MRETDWRQTKSPPFEAGFTILESGKRQPAAARPE